MIGRRGFLQLIAAAAAAATLPDVGRIFPTVVDAAAKPFMVVWGNWNTFTMHVRGEMPVFEVNGVSCHDAQVVQRMCRLVTRHGGTLSTRLQFGISESGEITFRYRERRQRLQGGRYRIGDVKSNDPGGWVMCGHYDVEGYVVSVPLPEGMLT